MVEIETRSRIPIWRTFGRIKWHVIPEPHATLQRAATWRSEVNDMLFQSHVWCCRVGPLPLSEFIVMIQEAHATLQGAVTWRNRCHDRATLQGVRIPSAILKIVFHHILFIFVLQFGLWRAAACVSSPIHSFYWKDCYGWARPVSES